MESIESVLMRRDGMSLAEAKVLVAEARAQLQEYLEDHDMDAAENICEEFFGLEPDYVIQLMSSFG